jgi:putative peptidoglycan lipid II flippase
MAITFISSFFGLARDITLSYFYGASPISDAYIIVTTIPLVLFGFAASAISIGYIPSYNKIEATFGQLEANRFTSNLINVIVIFCMAIVIFALLFKTPIVKLFALGFEGETLNIALKMTNITIWNIIFLGLTVIFTAYLQIKDNFLVPALIGFPMNIIVVISILISVKTNVLVLAVGSLIATIVQFLMLITYVRRTGYRHNWSVNLRDENIKSMVYVIIPVIIGMSVNQVNIIIDKTVASKISIGGISTLTYSQRLNAFVMAIVVYSITTVMYPLISKMASEKDISGLKKMLHQAVTGVNLLVIPASFGIMVLSEPLVRLLFGRGAFDEQAIAVTSSALFFYSIGMIGFGLKDVLNRFFFSLQDVRTPMINGVIAALLNIIMTITFSRFMGISGVALATSVSALISTGLLFYNLHKKIGSIDIRENLGCCFKILVASSFMAIGVKFVVNASDGWPQFLSIGCAVLVGILIYILFIFLLRVDVSHITPDFFARSRAKTNK